MQHSAPSADGPLLRLSLPNDSGALETARRAVLDLLRSRDVPARAIQRVELVLEEVLINFVWHAHPDGGCHDIDVTAQVLGDQLVLTFADDGVAFDPLQVRSVPRPTSLDAAIPGGLGLTLIRKSVSDARYERVDGRNRLTLQVDLRA